LRAFSAYGCKKCFTEVSQVKERTVTAAGVLNFLNREIRETREREIPFRVFRLFRGSYSATAADGRTALVGEMCLEAGVLDLEFDFSRFSVFIRACD
jgi:hypothetical protein